MDTVDLLLHPVRLRIVHAMSGERPLTTSQLCALLPDVSKATVYRHVGLLADGGLLEVDGEQRVRGAVERRYRLHRARAVIDADTAASVSPEDHRRVFAVAMATLLAEFNAYLDRDHADPAADSVGYRQHTLWLSQDERAEMIKAMRGVILARRGNGPAPDRTRHLLSPILFPTEEPPPRTSGEQAEPRR
ncbi:helix-turn-helix domain-containing protein [Actinomadura sp. HBU206391]|uniref:helix-turn-helix domain-containing protein n=1 Tax=Actinomadura sp. HBU206391 TaxID=2731692 RepID=UPI0016505F5C|nr:helix-turn-helix domain-containing protein [Actinomadura sp. HBU206391]MBC6457284.1 helix-turn-helix domain-containing protein [Actinomadura sp. HBU206391]